MARNRNHASVTLYLFTTFNKGGGSNTVGLDTVEEVERATQRAKANGLAYLVEEFERSSFSTRY